MQLRGIAGCATDKFPCAAWPPTRTADMCVPGHKRVASPLRACPAGHVYVDTQMHVSYPGPMKVKRTYNLSPAAIATVKRLVEVAQVAPSQDALVEHAIAELDRLVRDAQLWSQAAHDPAFQAEIRQIDEDLAQCARPPLWA